MRSSSKGCPDKIKEAHRKSTKPTDTHRENTDMEYQNDKEPAVIASSLTKVTTGLMRDGNLTAIREDWSSATIHRPAVGKSDTETIAASVERMEAKGGPEYDSDDGIISTTIWTEVFDLEQGVQELEEELRDVDNPWVVSDSLAAMTAPWQVAATTADTSAPRRCWRFLPSLPRMLERLSSTHRISRSRWTRRPPRLHRDRWRRPQLIR